MSLRVYEEVGTTTEPKVTLVVKAYDSIVSSLKKASGLMAEGNLQRSLELTSKATQIIFELLFALDLEEGGEIAARLNSLYTFALGKIADAEKEKNHHLLSEITDIFETLKEGWEGVAKKVYESPHIEPPAEANIG